MSEDTVDIPRRARQVRRITGALAAIPTASPDAPELLRDLESLSDSSFGELSESDKLTLLQSMRRQMVEQQQRYLSLLNISSALGATLDRREFLQMTMEHITKVMQAQRSTLFLVDKSTGELHGTIAQRSETEIVLQPGQGIAGWVAQSGQSLNIKDVYDDPRFHQGVDHSTGFTTRAMLCQPVRNADGEIVAVLQVLNSDNGYFSEEDAGLLSAIGGQISIALENSALYHSLIDKNRKLLETKSRLEHKIAELDLLFDIQRRLSQPSDLESLVKTITQKTLELVNGKACALALREQNAYRVYVMIDRSADYSRDWHFYTRMLPPDNQMVATQVIDSGELFSCDGTCRRIPGPTAREAALDAHNIIAVPLFDDESCIGALQAFNLVLPHDPNTLGFTEDDEKVLTLIASQIASTVASRRRRELREKEDRLSTIGQMIAGILHDFKTPFSVINGYVQLMADTDDAATRSEYAERVVRQFRDLNQMTRELLRFARGESQILLRKVFLHKFIDEVAELLRQEFEDHEIDFQIDLNYRGEALLDPVKMKRAMLNLARNAIEAMPEGGHFRIGVDLHEDGDNLCLTFRDTGQGIPPEIQDHIFESFVTRGKSDGTGLGLAVVKKIVDEHGGSVRFESTPGQGTTFFIDLPLHPPERDSK